MRVKDRDAFRRWFADYTEEFLSGSSEDRRNVVLKIEHTRHVCENAIAIALAEDLHDADLLMAETAALFHDIGRFPQYRQFRTFRDSASVNHGKLGAEVLSEEQVLLALPAEEQRQIRDVVLFHNAFALAGMEDRQALRLLKIVRDADKLDIWRVFAELDSLPEDEKASAAMLGLPDVPICSAGVLSAIAERRMATLSDVASVADFRLMQLSWVFDLNFPVSFRILKEQGHLLQLTAALPRSDSVMAAIEIVFSEVDAQAAVDKAAR